MRISAGPVAAPQFIVGDPNEDCSIGVVLVQVSIVRITHSVVTECGAVGQL